MRIFYPFLMKVVAEGIPIYSQERNGGPYEKSVAPEVEPLPFPGRHSSIIVSEHAEQPPARPRTEPPSQIELDWLRHGATLRLHSSAWPVTPALRGATTLPQQQQLLRVSAPLVSRAVRLLRTNRSALVTFCGGRSASLRPSPTGSFRVACLLRLGVLVPRDFAGSGPPPPPPPPTTTP